MSKLLFTLGEALAVLLADTTPLRDATRFERIISGAEVNVAAGFTRVGHRARLVTRVGTDPLGDAIASQLEDWHIDARISRDAARPTGTLVRTVGGVTRGEAVNLRRCGAIETLTPTHVENAWTDDVDAVFISGITAVRSATAAAAVRRTVELARDVGAVVVLDPNIRPGLADPEVFARELAPLRGRIDIAIGDGEELALLAGTGRQDAASALLDTGVRIVVEKLGADGAVASDATGQVREPAHIAPADVIDTVGAGDAFAAAFIAAVVEGASLQRMLARASTAAAEVVRTRGDVPRRSNHSVA